MSFPIRYLGLLAVLAACEGDGVPIADRPQNATLLVTNANGDTLLSARGHWCLVRDGVAEMYRYGQYQATAKASVPLLGAARCLQ